MENTHKDIRRAVSNEHDGLRPEIDLVIKKHGLSVDDFIKCMKGGLSATRDIKDRDGDVIETVADWNVRHKFFSSGMELLGYLKGSGTNVTVVNEGKKEAEEAFNRWRLNDISDMGGNNISPFINEIR